MLTLISGRLLVLLLRGDEGRGEGAELEMLLTRSRTLVEGRTVLES